MKILKARSLRVTGRSSPSVKRIATLARNGKIDGARLAVSAPMDPNFDRLAKRGDSASANVGAFAPKR